MDINQLKSSLKMENLYFSKCSIEREKVVSNGNLEMDLNKYIVAVAEHVFDVTLQLTVTKKDFRLLIVANARFTFETDDYSEEKNIIGKNTVAIMFPFIRSQATLMTSQPGMQPIVLPPINTTKL